MKDIAFREKEFDIWNSELTDHKAVKLENAGHYPHEEATEIFIKEIKRVSV